MIICIMHLLYYHKFVAVYKTGTGAWGPGTWGRKTRDLGTSSGGRGDRWDGDAVREIQGHGGHKDINDNCKSQR